MEKYQNNWKKKTHQQQQLHQPKVMQLAAAGPSKSRPHEKALQILPPPPPPPPTIPPPNNIEKNITITDQNKTKNNNTTTSEEELKLAAIAVSLNVRLRTSGMPVSMQEHALRYTRLLINTSASASAAAPPPQAHRLSPTLLARSLKKEFDGLYGPAWHCVVGKSFGSFVTHSPGGFVYFSLDSLSFLLFKTEVQLVIN